MLGELQALQAQFTPHREIRVRGHAGTAPRHSHSTSTPIMVDHAVRQVSKNESSADEKYGIVYIVLRHELMSSQNHDEKDDVNHRKRN